MELSPAPYSLNPKIIFIGTPEFGVIILEKLIKAHFKPVLVITAPDKPVGRKQIFTPPPVKLLAEKNKISVLQPKKILDIKYKIQNTNPDLIIVAAYGQIIPKDILDIPRYGSLNIHPSSLPEYKGATPVQFAILNGDKITGVTIILMDEKMDHGPIIANSKFQIPNSKITSEELLKELANLGANLLIKIIPKWIKGEIKPKLQDESRATYTKILKREDGKIDWRKSAKYIEQQIRAFQPWPGSYTLWKKKGKLMKIKILKARVLKSPGNISYPVGKTLIITYNELGVQCGEDFFIIERLQMEGKKEMTSGEFIRGQFGFIGTILDQKG